jgi:hypothetical protein
VYTDRLIDIDIDIDTVMDTKTGNRFLNIFGQDAVSEILMSVTTDIGQVATYALWPFQQYYLYLYLKVPKREIFDGDFLHKSSLIRP